MEFDLIYPNYNKQKRKTKNKTTTNKQITWLTTTEVQPYLHGSRFDVEKKEFIYVIRNITPSCRQNQATLC